MAEQFKKTIDDFFNGLTLVIKSDPKNSEREARDDLAVKKNKAFDEFQKEYKQRQDDYHKRVGETINLADYIKELK